MTRLQNELGWVPYERKHGENRFTRFYQKIYLPEKYGFDKRKAHFSSLILAGQMTREEAMEDLEKPFFLGPGTAAGNRIHTPQTGFPPRAMGRNYACRACRL